jgi:spore coat protein U domain-containing protein, fimbrial subunit CupE1/2/3/6
VADNCIVSTTALAFGAYDPIVTNKTTDLTGTATVSATCTSGASATIRLSQGDNDGSGTTAVPARNLKSGSDTLAYFLYQPDGTTVWGDTTGTGVSATADGTSNDYTVNGTITAGQNVPAHTDYTDTVVVSIDF